MRFAAACVFLFFFSLVFGVYGQAAAAPYHATIIIHEKGYSPRACGTVAVADRKARLTADLGDAGMYQALIRFDQKTLIVFSETMKEYVEIPIHGDEKSLQELIQRVMEALSPLGLPILVVREENKTVIGSGDWHGYSALKTRSRLVAELMGMSSSQDILVWDNADFAPFPLFAQEIKDSASLEATGNSLELHDIKFGPVEPGIFAMPEGYTRRDSPLEFILYALSKQ
jgi:hypothetical protein